MKIELIENKSKEMINVEYGIYVTDICEDKQIYNDTDSVKILNGEMRCKNEN